LVSWLHITPYLKSVSTQDDYISWGVETRTWMKGCSGKVGVSLALLYRSLIGQS
jgi:hypothetical protein